MAVCWALPHPNGHADSVCLCMAGIEGGNFPHFMKHVLHDPVRICTPDMMHTTLIAQCMSPTCRKCCLQPLCLTTLPSRACLQPFYVVPQV